MPDSLKRTCRQCGFELSAGDAVCPKCELLAALNPVDGDGVDLNAETVASGGGVLGHALPPQENPPLSKIENGSPEAETGSTTPAEIETDAVRQGVRKSHADRYVREELSLALPQITLGEQVGRGGMGAVYSASHRGLDRNVAIKVIALELADHGESSERFTREAQALAQLDHPNVVRIHDFGETKSGLLYLVMDLVEGDDLSSILKTREVPVRDALELVRNVCDALHYTHGRGFLHRDIKPSNILVERESGKPLITDYGLAKKIDTGDATLTRTGFALGTPAYMAPEQANANEAEIGPRTDVYSVGTVLYELLVGQPPFEGTTAELFVAAQEGANPTAPRKVNPKLHKDLETICLKAMAPEPRDRYESAQELSQDIERFQNGDGIEARSVRASQRVWRKVRRHPIRTAAYSAILALLIAGAAFSWTASAKFRLNRAMGEVDQLLGASEWSEESMSKIGSSLERIKVLSANSHEIAKSKVVRSFSDYVEAQIISPRLTRADVDQIEVTMNGMNAAVGFEGETLRNALLRRLATWESRVRLVSPFSNESQWFSKGSVIREDGVPLHRVPPKKNERKKDRQPLMTNIPINSDFRTAATFDQQWSDAEVLGVEFGQNPKEGYGFVLKPAPTQLVAPQNSKESPSVPFKMAIAEGLPGMIQILRGATVIAERQVDIGALNSGRLTMTVSREGDLLRMQLGTNALEVKDIFPLRGTGDDHVSLIWPAEVGMISLMAEERMLPADTTPLEDADQAFIAGQFEAARERYNAQTMISTDREIVQEARLKEALCLQALDREIEANQLREQLLTDEGTVWPAIAGCQLWLSHMEHRDYEKADSVFITISSRFDYAKIMSMLPHAVKLGIAKIVEGENSMSLFGNDRDRVGRLSRTYQLQKAVGIEGVQLSVTRWLLMRANHAAGNLETALDLAQKISRQEGLSTRFTPHNELAWLLSVLGRDEEALQHISGLLALEPGNRNQERRQCELFVERARIYCCLGRWDEAEEDLNEYERLREDFGDIYFHYVRFCLLHGLIQRRRGDEEAAVSWWERGLYRNWDGNSNKQIPAGMMNGQTLTRWTILGSFSGAFSEGDADHLMSHLSAKVDQNSPLLVIKKLGGFPPEMFRELWAGDRQVKIAEEIALGKRSMPEVLHALMTSAAFQLIKRGAFDGRLTEVEKDLIWELLNSGADDFRNEKLEMIQIVQLGLCWQGHFDALSWKPLKANLPSQLVAATAYVLAKRCLKLGLDEESKMLLEEAIATSGDGNKVKGLAKQALDAL